MMVPVAAGWMGTHWGVGPKWWPKLGSAGIGCRRGFIPAAVGQHWAQTNTEAILSAGKVEEAAVAEASIDEALVIGRP